MYLLFRLQMTDMVVRHDLTDLVIRNNSIGKLFEMTWLT